MFSNELERNCHQQNTFINSPSVSFSALHEEKYNIYRENCMEEGMACNGFLNQSNNEPVSFNFTATDSCAISQADGKNQQSAFLQQAKQNQAIL